MAALWLNVAALNKDSFGMQVNKEIIQEKTYNDSLKLFESVAITEANIQAGKPITYRADFPDPQLLPKLIRIRVNDRTICSVDVLPATSTIFTLHHIFYPSRKTLSGPTQPPRLIIPFTILNPITTVEVLTPTTEQIPTSTTNLSTSCGQEGSNLTLSTPLGNDFERGRFPWLTAIYLLTLPVLKFKCSGTLISDRVVISVASCFDEAVMSLDQYAIHLGRHNLFFSESGTEHRSIQTLITHPEHKATNFTDADIALLHMREPVSFTKFIRPICLWSSSLDLSYKVGHAVGWGANPYNRYITPVPKLLDVDIAGGVNCLQYLASLLNVTSPRLLCAINGYRKAFGLRAYGSGLMINLDGKWILRAISSLVIFTREPKEYLVYCDLARHSAWVQENMRQ